MPYDPYNVIKKLHETRVKEHGVDPTSDKPFLTYTKDSKENLKKPIGEQQIELSSEHIDNFLYNNYLPQESSPHRIRHMWSNITKQMERKAAGGKLKSLWEFMDTFMLGHEGEKASGEKYYLGDQAAEITGFRQKVVLDLYDLYIQGKLNNTSLNRVLKTA